jgi:hypothetical protein
MDVYMKSGYRHFNDWWAGHRYGDTPMNDRKPVMAALCGLLFNVMGYMHEELKRHPEVDFDGDDPTPEMKERQAKLNEEPWVPPEIEFLNTNILENIEEITELKCLQCMSTDKTWDKWPCSECSENDIGLGEAGPHTHCYFSARQGIVPE